LQPMSKTYKYRGIAETVKQ